MLSMVKTIKKYIIFKYNCVVLAFNVSISIFCDFVLLFYDYTEENIVTKEVNSYSLLKVKVAIFFFKEHK